MNNFSTIIFIVTLFLFSCNNSTENEKQNLSDFDFGPVIPISKTVSDGTTWQKTHSLPDTSNANHFTSLQDLFVTSEDEILVATDYAGVFYSNDTGSSWQTINDGLILNSKSYPGEINFNVTAIKSKAGKFVAGSTDLIAGTGVYVYNSILKKWDAKTSYAGAGYISSIGVAKNGFIFAGYVLNGDYRVIYSKDEGQSWEDLTGSLTNHKFGQVFTFAFLKNKIYIGTSTGIYLSSDLQGKWERIYFPYSQVLAVAIDANGNLYASSYGRAFKKIKDGEDWEQIFSVPSGRNVRQIIATADNKIFVAACDGVFRSKDFGKSWVEVGLHNLIVHRLAVNSKGNLIAGTVRKGIYFSTY